VSGYRSLRTHTPDTEEVRESYQSTGDGLDFKRRYNERGEEFDRWLEAHDAALIVEHERVLAERAAPQEWEYGVTYTGHHVVSVQFTLESALAAQSYYQKFPHGKTSRVFRRHPAIPATPWEPLPEDANQTEGGRDA
jgi:hypothetical protein